MCCIWHAIDPGMNNWNKVKQIFSEAIELNESERKKYVKMASKSDSELQQEVLSLLEAHEMPGALDQSIDELRLSAITVAKEDRMKGRRIGRYRIADELGHGGMGSVYRAERADGEFEQIAALKLLHSPFATVNQVKRFKSERQILASLKHPNIAELYDGGFTSDGQPYIVMEYLEGKSLMRHCDDLWLTVRERLHLFMEVCEAVQYAHRKLVVHRDLKPSNIMVTDSGSVKLLDFGIAKVMNSTEQQSSEYVNLTLTSILPITPSYASPEQIRKQEITTASDIYQLGLVLYELLAGCRAYNVEEATPAELEQIICEVPPTRPSLRLINRQHFSDGKESANSIVQISRARNTRPAQLKKALEGDLDTIILNALRKDPEQRYSSVGHFMADLHRYLSDKPVSARPATVPYRLGKWFKRHKVAALASFVVILSLTIGAAVALWQANKANQAAEQARAALQETEQALNRAESLHGFLLDLFRAAEPDRPQDQLPSTEELLALGAQRALNENSASKGERMGMLLAIGDVYVALGREEEAKPLLDAAIKLGENQTGQHSEGLARALSLKAVIAMREFRISDAEEWLLRAESIAQNSEQMWAEFVRVREYQAQLESMRGNFRDGLDLVEPVYEEIKKGRRVPAEIHYKVGARLASLYTFMGDLNADLDIRDELEEISDQINEPESYSNAIHLAGLAGTQFRLGKFEEAETNLLKAIDLYDQIFEHPTETRALASMRLGLVKFYTGRYDQALERIKRASREWAFAQGRDPEEHEFGYFLLGELHLQIHQWDDADKYLLRARELFGKIGEQSKNWISIIDAMRANIACQNGNTEKGLLLLPNGNSFKSDNPAYQSHIHEARAVCYYESGQKKRALKEIDTALNIFDFPGYALVHAKRKLFKSRILHSLGRFDEGSKTLNCAERLFDEVGHGNHPFTDIIAKARDETRQTIPER